jgi:type I restriction enzyme S subunit
MRQEITLSQLFRIGSSKRVLQSQWKSEGVPFYRGREITKLAMDGVVDNELFIDEELYTEYATKYGVPDVGDIMITAIGTIGNSYVVQPEHRFYFKDASVLWLKTISSVSSQFINYWLKSPQFFDQLDRGNGATVDTLTIQKLQSVRVDLPSPLEQHRIVAILDAAFDGIATAKANAEQNLQNARALFESHLQKVFTEREGEWVEKAVREIAAPTKGSIRTGPFGSQLLHSEFVDEGIAVLGIDNAVANEFRWGKSRFITPEKYQQLARYTVHPGDVLITIMGTCGRCAIVPDDIPTAINTKHICCITLDHKQCLPGYLHIYFLYAPQSREFLAKHAKGSIMAGLNMGLIQELPVMLPPIEVQTKIVAAAYDIHSETQRLESIYQQKLAALDGLKKSLLHQAFSGQM